MKHSILTILLAGTLLAGCDRSNEPLPIPTGYIIGLQNGEIASRAYQQFADGSTFGLFAFTSPSGIFDNTLRPDLLYNTKTTRNGGAWVYTTPAQWPDTATVNPSKRVQFFAYTPHQSSVAAGAIEVSAAETQGFPSITVTLGLERGPIDFAISRYHHPIGRAPLANDSVWMSSRQHNYVNIRFDRKLAEVGFRGKYIRPESGKENRTRMYINSIRLKNIYRKATFSYASNGDETYTPSAPDAISGATLNLANTTIPISTTGYNDITNPNNDQASRIKLLPQTYENVELSVFYTLEYYDDKGSSEYYVVGEKRIPLSAAWKMGMHYTYDLEFYFSEILGDNPSLSVKVLSWTENPIDIDIN